MANRYAHRRSSDPTHAFPNPLNAGEIAVNSANRQLAVGDVATVTAGVPLPLIAVRYFDARAQYAINDYVINGAGLYRAKVAVAPGAFNAANFATFLDDTQVVAKAGDTMTGQLTLPTGPAAANAVRKDYVDAAIAAIDLTPYAPKASPIFTGDPKAPTPTAGDNDTSIATTAFVTGALAGKADASALAAKADLASPTFIGNPTAPTPAVNDNDTSIATTAFVLAQPISLLVDGIVTFAKMAASALATTAQYLANTSNKILTTDQVWAAVGQTSLIDAATVTPDFSQGIQFYWPIGGVGRTLANPLNMKPGQSGIIMLQQDGTGGRTITTWGSNWKFPGGVKPTLTATPGAIDVISYYCLNNSNFIVCSFLPDVK